MNGNTDRLDRREFLRGTGFAGAAGLVGLRPDHALAEPPPETTTIRLYRPPTTNAGLCVAPQLVAEDLLRAEGFTDVQYGVRGRVGANRALAAGDIDITLGFVGNWIRQIDAGDPIVLLGGGHIGCYERSATSKGRRSA